MVGHWLGPIISVLPPSFCPRLPTLASRGRNISLLCYALRIMHHLQVVSNPTSCRILTMPTGTLIPSLPCLLLVHQAWLHFFLTLRPALQPWYQGGSRSQASYAHAAHPTQSASAGAAPSVDGDQPGCVCRRPPTRYLSTTRSARSLVGSFCSQR